MEGEFERPEISVVIPVYRNAGTLKELYHRLCSVMEDQLSFEVLFINDACPEGSLSMLRRLALDDARVAVLALEDNVGQQRAVLIGLSLARGTRVVVMDSDLQDPPEAIPRLIAATGQGFSAVFAGRRGSYESPFRLLTSRIFKHLIHLLCDVPEDAGIFVVMDRPLVDRLLGMNPSLPFLIAMIGCTGLRTTSVPVVREPRPMGKSAYTFWKRLTVGCCAVLWVLLWRWGPRRLAIKKQRVEVPFKKY